MEAPSSSSSSSWRLATWNVNGWRPLLGKTRAEAFVLSFRTDSTSLPCDILCVQEHKLGRAELDAFLSAADGTEWDSYWAHNETSAGAGGEGGGAAVALAANEGGAGVAGAAATTTIGTAAAKGGYSGVATFVCRSRVPVLDASVGFTGLLPQTSSATTTAATTAWSPPPPPPPPLPPHLEALWANEDHDRLRLLDSEGRCVVTDHGAFLLFNVYIPAVTGADEQRAELRWRFKLELLRCLGKRLRCERARGRRVVLVGDLNIAASAMDTAAGAASGDFNAGRADRLWLATLCQKAVVGGGAGAAAAAEGWDGDGEDDDDEEEEDPLLLQGVPAHPRRPPPLGRYDRQQELHQDGWAPPGSGGGAGGPPGRRRRRAAPPGGFVDVFRALNPTAVGAAYTCWNTASGARQNNYGSRIDYILAADGDVREEQEEGGAAAAAGAATANGSTGRPPPPFATWFTACAAAQHVQGSDHAPVWCDLQLPPSVAAEAAAAAATAARRPPALAARHRHGHGGAQRNVRDMFAAAAAKRPAPGPPDVQAKTTTTTATTTTNTAAAAAPPPLKKAATGGSNSNKPAASSGGPRQSALTSFFGAAVKTTTKKKTSSPPAAAQQPPPPPPPPPITKPPAAAAAAPNGNGGCGGTNAFARMALASRVPLCAHGEPCREQTVGKEGANKGRRFWCCARGEGTVEGARCEAWEWLDEWLRRQERARQAGQRLPTHAKIKHWGSGGSGAGGGGGGRGGGGGYGRGGGGGAGAGLGGGGAAPAGWALGNSSVGDGGPPASAFL